MAEIKIIDTLKRLSGEKRHEFLYLDLENRKEYPDWHKFREVLSELPGNIPEVTGFVYGSTSWDVVAIIGAVSDGKSKDELGRMNSTIVSALVRTGLWGQNGNPNITIQEGLIVAQVAGAIHMNPNRIVDLGAHPTLKDFVANKLDEYCRRANRAIGHLTFECQKRVAGFAGGQQPAIETVLLAINEIGVVKRKLGIPLELAAA